MEINEKEVLRYLGYRNHQADDAVLKYIEETKTELQSFLAPQYVYGQWKCTVDPAGTVGIESIIISSKNLASHIMGCECAVLFAVTLGVAADTAIRRYSITDSARAAVAQAVCAAMLEGLCDEIERHVSDEAAADGLHCRPRFSPGFGDFSLCHQKDILALLERKKRIGITLTDSFMMIPTKSVTALIGQMGCSKTNSISSQPQRGVS